MDFMTNYVMLGLRIFIGQSLVVKIQNYNKKLRINKAKCYKIKIIGVFFLEFN